MVISLCQNAFMCWSLLKDESLFGSDASHISFCSYHNALRAVGSFPSFIYDVAIELTSSSTRDDRWCSEDGIVDPVILDSV